MMYKASMTKQNNHQNAVKNRVDTAYKKMKNRIRQAQTHAKTGNGDVVLFVGLFELTLKR